MRLGLFHQLLWPVLGVLAVSVMGLGLFSNLFFEQTFYRAWRSDLQQEAEWTAEHFMVRADVAAAADPTAAHLAEASGEALARAWRSSHDSIRLTVFDDKGSVLIDSAPDRPTPPSDPAGLRGRIAGRAPVDLGGTSGVLVLTRLDPPEFPVYFHNQMVVAGLLLIALAALAVYPVVRHLTRNFGELSALAQRVAEGGYGATLEVRGRNELADLVRAFNHMSLRLQDEELRRRRLIADVSHELRSPMARLRAMAETVARRPREAPANLVRMDAEIALMDRLVGDLLQTARAEEGGVILQRERLSVRAWAEDAFQRFQRRIEGAGVACTVSLDPDDVEAELDPQRLMQAVGNLVENALNAVAGVRAGRIVLAYVRTPDGAALTVRDNGRGVPSQDLPFVFDRFFRVERDRGRGSGGVGLGLSITRAIAEAHGGQVSLESVQGAGATATLLLPAAS